MKNYHQKQAKFFTNNITEQVFFICHKLGVDEQNQTNEYLSPEWLPLTWNLRYFG